LNEIVLTKEEATEWLGRAIVRFKSSNIEFDASGEVQQKQTLQARILASAAAVHEAAKNVKEFDLNESSCWHTTSTEKHANLSTSTKTTNVWKRLATVLLPKQSCAQMLFAPKDPTTQRCLPTRRFYQVHMSKRELCCTVDQRLNKQQSSF
jgi:hypothetical protein